MAKHKHTLVVIGYLGRKTAYLDVPRDIAISRYKRDNPNWIVDAERISMFSFDDAFGCYEAWSSE